MYNATMQTYFTPSLPTPSLLYSLLLTSSLLTPLLLKKHPFPRNLYA